MQKALYDLAFVKCAIVYGLLQIYKRRQRVVHSTQLNLGINAYHFNCFQLTARCGDGNGGG